KATRRARFGLNAGALMQFPATTLLLAINTAVFVGMVVGGGSIMGFNGEITKLWGGNVGPYTLSGEYWRLVTAGFLHANLLHSVLTMLCLWNLGQLPELLFGTSVTLAVYLLTGVGGSLLSVAIHPYVNEVGASGAIFGIAGAVLSGVKFGKVPLATIQKRQIF